MTESQFWQSVKRAMPLVHWVRIESSAGSGVPDVNGYYAGVEFWLELKIMSGNQLRLRHSQVAWLRRRYSAGARNIYVIARKNDEIFAYSGNVAFLPPVRVDKFSTYVVPDTPLLVLKKPFSWEQLWQLFRSNK